MLFQCVKQVSPCTGRYKNKELGKFQDSQRNEVDTRDGPGIVYLQHNPLKPGWEDVYLACQFEEQTEYQYKL